MSVSFHDAEAGATHQAPCPTWLRPERSRRRRRHRRSRRHGLAIPAPILSYFGRERPIELRPVDIERYLRRAPREPRFHVWMRAAAACPTIRRSTAPSSPTPPT